MLAVIVREVSSADASQAGKPLIILRQVDGCFPQRADVEDAASAREAGLAPTLPHVRCAPWPTTKGASIGRDSQGLQVWTLDLDFTWQSLHEGA